MSGESGYRACACRDCFEIAIGVGPTLCWSCNEAGCSVDGRWPCHADDHDDVVNDDDVDCTGCEHELRPADEFNEKCIRCGMTGPYDDNHGVSHGSQ